MCINKFDAYSCNLFVYLFVKLQITILVMIYKRIFVCKLPKYFWNQHAGSAAWRKSARRRRGCPWRHVTDCVNHHLVLPHLNKCVSEGFTLLVWPSVVVTAAVTVAAVTRVQTTAAIMGTLILFHWKMDIIVGEYDNEKQRKINAPLNCMEKIIFP